MQILDTLKNWADCELKLIDQKLNSFNMAEKAIIRWYFFGSCDICTQAMGLSDNDFQYFYRETLRHIGIPNDEIEESIGVWMLDKINQNEMVVIERGALNFRQFKDNPNGLGGLKECFLKFSKSYNNESSIES